MSENAQSAFELFKAAEGKESATGEWMEVDQERINQFADVTIDHQFIHVDPERAKDTPFGTTIAHGFLTLSLLTHLGATAQPENPDPARMQGVVMGVNYGFDKVRFPSPVPVGARIRTTGTLKRVEIKGGMIETMNELVVEIEGQEKPCCVAESLGRMVF